MKKKSKKQLEKAYQYIEDKKHTKAFRTFLKGSTRGDKEYYFTLATLYDLGEGTKANKSKAIYLV